MHSTSRPYEGMPAVLTLSTVLFYAAGYPIGSATVAVMSPFLVIVLRFAVSALVLWGIVVARKLPSPTRSEVVWAAVAGLLTQAVQFLGLYWGLSHGVAGGLASLLIALNPVTTALILRVVLGHRESRMGLLALFLGTVAVVLACLPKLIADHRAGVGVVAVLIGMLGLSLGGIVQSRRCSGMDAMMITAIGLTASIPCAGLLAISRPEHTSNLPKAAALLAAMVVISSVGATTLYAQCIKRSGARGASILFALIPAVATFLGWAFLDERMTIPTILALLLGAGACAVQARSKS